MSLKIIKKTLGDAVSTVEGIAGMTPGAATISGRITLVSGEAALCTTGVVEGAPAIAISAEAVAVGTIELAVAGGELLSGGMKMTIRPLEGIIKDKDIVLDGKGITGKDADTGIEFSVRKLEEEDYRNGNIR